MGSGQGWIQLLVESLTVLYLDRYFLSVSDVPAWTWTEIDLGKLQKWLDKWLLQFIPDKCKVVCIGHNH